MLRGRERTLIPRGNQPILGAFKLPSWEEVSPFHLEAAASPSSPNSTPEKRRRADILLLLANAARLPDPKAFRRPAHADSAAASHTPGRLPPAARPGPSALTAPQPADAASSRASTLPYQRWGGAMAPAAYQREPRPGEPSRRADRQKAIGRRRRGGGGASPGPPRPPPPSSGGLQLSPRPEQEPSAGGRAQLLPSASGDGWAPHSGLFSPPRPRTWWPPAR